MSPLFCTLEGQFDKPVRFRIQIFMHTFIYVAENQLERILQRLLVCESQIFLYITIHRNNKLQIHKGWLGYVINKILRVYINVK